MALILSLTEKQRKALEHLLNYQAGSEELIAIQAKMQKARNNEKLATTLDSITDSTVNGSAGTPVDQPVGDSRSGPDGYSDHSSIGTTSWKD